MEAWEREAVDLGIEKFLDTLERNEVISREHVCRCCGRPIRYSAPDALFVHEDGRYFCDNPPLFARKASP